MELIMKKLFMLQRKCEAVSQITFDEDMNVPDVKPDIGRMIQKKGTIQIEDIQISEGRAYIFCMSATVRSGGYRALWELCGLERP